MVTLKKFDNGFAYIEIQNLNAVAKIALQGAHIFEYKRSNGEDILWLSDKSDFEEGKAIRGGVPICWPRFGSFDSALPPHGFARTMLFTFLGAKEIDEGRTVVSFKLQDNPQSREIWEYKFELEVNFIIGDTLEIELKTTNKDDKEFMITQALHSYFNVSEINNVKILGLEDKPYLDTLTNKEELQKGEIFFDKEVDRVYQDVKNEIVLADNLKELHLNAVGSSSAIVWNPWIDKCARMSAMDKEAYREFVCIESANAQEDFRIVCAGESHALNLTIE
ncbi:D-hexose-6-phosphate mutarotase [Sulfurimonas sp.]|uniref:D-hexose-6-phosphate mutarotase n=1 Tax=Sulfurimonas sp. TaxID=2022749 RepID=UPI002633D2EC|nr:D-hexose-6-phosphate mutarotase [Sulfurimonas sp.]